MIEFSAPPAWRSIDFISDLHLGENMPRTFVAWCKYVLNTSADAVIILGDLFEAWVGDDARFSGFEAEVAEVLQKAALRRPVAFMAGNRDFLVGPEMLAACGMAALPDPTVLLAFGARTLLSHGDAWCLDDIEYQQVRRIVRDPIWQRDVLARPLAERRVMAAQMRTASERRSTPNADMSDAAPSDAAPGSSPSWFDVDTSTATRFLIEADADVLVHGHTHRPATESLAPGLVRHVLSDWDLDHAPGAPRAEVLRFGEAGWRRITPEQASTPIAR